jgi:hypothetical protein
MTRERDERRRKRPLEELQEIARRETKAALEGHEIPDEVRQQLVLGIDNSNLPDCAVFDIYLPKDPPEQGLVLTRATVDAYTGECSVEVFHGADRLGIPAIELEPD